MRLNTDHFHQKQPVISDDDFKVIVRESDCIYQIMKKYAKGNNRCECEKILKRIEDLDIDISHFKKRNTRTEYRKKIDAIDDETFKMLVNNSRNWTNLLHTCGYAGYMSKKKVVMRIEKLGLDTKHFDNDVISTDKIFVVDSHFTESREIKKRLICDFDRAYECAGCKNEHFTKCDGVLMWNNKEIMLQLEHKNGIHNDNRLDNLEFLCPSCHSQTCTFTSKNSKKHKADQKWIEEGKTSHAPGSIASLLN